MGIPKRDLVRQLENRFAAAISHMHVDRLMIVAVEEETKSISFENPRQG